LVWALYTPAPAGPHVSWAVAFCPALLRCPSGPHIN
jgi:hypothetical protein